MLYSGSGLLCQCAQATSHFLLYQVSVTRFILRSLIHLDLSLVQGNRYGLICILIHVNKQLCQHHLLKMFSFIHCIILASLSKKSGVHSFVDLSQGLQFSSIDPHVCFYANTKLFYCYSSILKLEIRDGDASRSFFVRIVLGLLAYVFHMKLRIVFTKSVK